MDEVNEGQRAMGRPLGGLKLRYDGSTVFDWDGRVVEQTVSHVLLAEWLRGEWRDRGYGVVGSSAEFRDL